MKQELAEITADRTGKPLEQILVDSDRDHWFSAREAQEYGFVDRVISTPQEVGNRATTEQMDADAPADGQNGEH